MAETIIGLNDPKAVKKWRTNLAVEVDHKSYFTARFVRDSDSAPIQRLTELENDAGDTISYDLVVQLRGEPTEGDQELEGKEEDLKFYTDEVKIDQMRKAVSAGGRMSRKRVTHNLRQVANDRLSDYWPKFLDELHFMYLSGARGINPDFITSTAYTGRAGNAFQAPDATHIVYPGAVTSKATLTATDTMTRLLVEKVETYTTMIRTANQNAVNLQPISIDGEDHFLLVMSPYQEHSLRTADTTGWMDIHKSLTTAIGRASPYFKGGIGMIKNVILHSHRAVIRFNDYGAGGNVLAARALFLGRQAGAIAYGTKSGSKYNWVEEPADYGNKINFASGPICGMKKCRFNSMDFGLLSVDTAATAA